MALLRGANPRRTTFIGVDAMHTWRFIGRHFPPKKGTFADNLRYSQCLNIPRLNQSFTFVQMFPFLAQDETSNDSTFSNQSNSNTGTKKFKSESIGEYLALAASLDRVLRQVRIFATV